MKSWTTKSGYKIIRIVSGRSNVFLLSNGIINILIDTSTKSNRNKLFSAIENLNIKKIDYLILTHTHFDHASNAHSLRDKFGCKVIVHRSEAAYLKQGENIAVNGTNPLSYLIMLILRGVFERFLKYESCSSDIIVDSIYSFENIGLNVNIIHTPGHSAGSISIIVDNEIAIVGDSMFGVFGNSVFPPFADNKETLVISWAKLLETKCGLFLPSHGSQKSFEQLLSDYNIRK